VDVAVHVNPLDRAAGLTAVEERAISQVLDRVREIGIGADVGRVLAAELQADAGKARSCGLLHAVPARDRAGEAHEIDRAACDHPRGRIVAEMEMLEHARRQPARRERLADALGAQRGLRRVLQDHRVARHQGRDHGVHRGEIRVVPGRDDEDDAERLSADEPGEARLVADRHVRERLVRHLDHVAGALLEPGHLAGRVAHRPPHLPGDLGRDLVSPRDEGVDGASEDRRALGDRDAAPPGLSAPGAPERGRDLALARERPLGVNLPVHRRDHLKPSTHAAPPLVRSG
jgi:hypothetical protein